MYSADTTLSAIGTRLVRKGQSYPEISHMLPLTAAINIRLEVFTLETMASKLASSRDPYPFPKLQNDENFYGTGNKQVK